MHILNTFHIVTKSKYRNKKLHFLLEQMIFHGTSNLRRLRDPNRAPSSREDISEWDQALDVFIGFGIKKRFSETVQGQHLPHFSSSSSPDYLPCIPTRKHNSTLLSTTRPVTKSNGNVNKCCQAVCFL